MRFRLSSLCLLLLLASISLAWFAEYSSRHKREIVGDWVWPIADHSNRCASTQLVIRADRTFTKIDYQPAGVYRFEGKYEFLRNGQVRFELTDYKRPAQVNPIPSSDDVDDDADLHEILGQLPIDHSFYCRYAIDEDGHLLLTCVRKVQDWESGFEFEHIYSPSDRVGSGQEQGR